MFFIYPFSCYQFNFRPLTV